MDWIAMLLTLIGLVFNVKKNIICWPIWILGNVFWIISAFYVIPILWSMVIINAVFIAMNILGWKVWLKEKRKIE